MRQDFRELAHHVFEDVGRGIMQKRFKSWEVDTASEDVLKGLLGL